MSMPTSNDQLEDVAAAGGTVYSGKTVIRLKTGGVMDVTNYNAAGGRDDADQRRRGRSTACSTSRTTAPATGEYPDRGRLHEPATCGNVYVSGTYRQSLTIAAANDVIVAPDARRQAVQQVQRRQHPPPVRHGRHARPDRQQLRARRHRSTARATAPATTTSTRPTIRLVKNVRIDAAILSLQHSFIVDNYDCGTRSARSRSTARSRRSTAARSAPARRPRSPRAT